jgi:hypothetical protein
MSSSTTIKINSDDLAWWNNCCSRLKMGSIEAFSRFKTAVMLKQQHEFFIKLPFPSNYHKPLENVKINKKYTKSHGIQ